jgi:hypothetical protein
MHRVMALHEILHDTIIKKRVWSGPKARHQEGLWQDNWDFLFECLNKKWWVDPNGYDYWEMVWLDSNGYDYWDPQRQSQQIVKKNYMRSG